MGKIDPIIERELNFQCLGCGADLRDKIMGHKIHIHLCEECRQIYFREFRHRLGETLREAEEKEESDFRQGKLDDEIRRMRG